MSLTPDIKINYCTGVGLQHVFTKNLKSYASTIIYIRDTSKHERSHEL